ncbi:MAG TPA: spermidine/putrescine ABC transporter substrate-binding protein [Anaerolineales bacterium]|nr:spermidine/putrescine ABC transporter substrate-binding protein [Anaerolineales bacterium]
MKRTTILIKLSAGFLALSILLTACGGGQAPQAAPATKIATEAPTAAATPAPVATQAPAASAPTPTYAPPAFTSKPSDKTASDGFTCPEPNPRMQVTSKELNLFVWTTYVPQDFYDCFQQVYGITVNYDEYSSNEDMIAKLSSGASSYDLIQPTDYATSILINQSMLQKLDHGQLSVLANFDPTTLNLSYDPGNQYTIPYEAGLDAIVVNTATVKDLPKAWADLWKPEYKGQMVFADDSRDVIGLTLLTLGFDVNTTDKSQLDQAKQKLAQLTPGIKKYDSDSPHSDLISGDVNLGETWTGEAFMAQQALPSIQFIYPTEGSIVWQDNFAIPKNAQHPDAAYAFLNYVNQPDMFWMMLTNYMYINPNAASLAYAKNNPMEVSDINGNTTTLGDVYNSYINSTITNPPLGVIQAGHRIQDVGAATPLYDQIWTEVKTGQ